MKRVRRLFALFSRRAEEQERRFDLRLRALGRPLPLRHRRSQTPFKNQQSRPAA